MSTMKVLDRLSLQICFVLFLRFLFLLFVKPVLIMFVMYFSRYEVLLLGQNILLSHPILLRGRFNLRTNWILKAESICFPLKPVVVIIYIGLLLQLVGRIIDVKLLNTIFNFQKHWIVFQFGVGRQALIKYLLLELDIFAHLVFICIGIQLETLMLFFKMSFGSSIIKTFHFFLCVFHFWMLAPINITKQILLHSLIFLILSNIF